VPSSRTKPAQLSDGCTVADALADEITAFNAALRQEIGPTGAVVGATVNGIAANVVSRLPRSLILAPGVGAQGASMDDVRRNFGFAIARTLPSVSRSILRHGPSLAAAGRARYAACICGHPPTGSVEWFIAQQSGIQYIEAIAAAHAAGRKMAAFLTNYDVSLSTTLAGPPLPSVRHRKRV